MLKKIIALSAIAVVATGCASKPEPRSAYQSLPELENGYSRVLITAGDQKGTNLWSVHQVGPVYIDEENVGQTADNETIVIDLKPGSYKAHCEPQDNYKTLIEKTSFSFKANKTYELYCDMAPHGSAGAFGAAGALSAKYLTTMFLQARTEQSENTIVSYKKL